MDLKSIRLTLAAISISALHLGAWAGTATPEEATAMVKKGVTQIKAAGADKTYAEISKYGGPFHDRDLYLTVYTMDGLVKAHGANPKMVGKNLLSLKDIEGKSFIAERIELAKTKSEFWQDYQFRNPETGKIEPKRMYCERLDDVVVCGGVYK